MDLPKILAESHQDLPFGMVQLNIKKHDGEIVTVDALKVSTHKVPNNTKALEIVLSLFRAMDKSKSSGNVTFTVTFKDGDANKVMVQDIAHHTSKRWG